MMDVREGTFDDQLSHQTTVKRSAQNPFFEVQKNFTDLLT